MKQAIVTVALLAGILYAASVRAGFEDSKLLQTCDEIRQLKMTITTEAIFVGPIMLDIETARHAKAVRIHRTDVQGNYALIVDPDAPIDSKWVFETDADHMNVMICLATYLNEMIDKVKRDVRMP